MWLVQASAAEDLMTIYRQAKRSDPVLKQSQAAYSASQELKPEARAALLPSISASAGYDREYQKWSPVGPSILQPGSDNFTNWNYGIQLTQPLFHYSSLVLLKQADARIGQAAAEQAAAEQNLMIRAAQRYFDTLSAMDDLRYAKADEEAIKRQLDQARQRYKVGLIASTDVQEAKARYDLARARVIAAENGLANAKEALRELTGSEHGTLAELGREVPLKKPDPENVSAWEGKAQQQNWQLAAAKKAAQVAMENIRVQRGGHYPTLDLVGQYGKQNSGGGYLPLDTNTASLGLQVNVPIYQGGGVNAKVSQAQYQYTGAEQKLEEVRRTVIRKTTDSYRGIESSILRVEALKQALASTQSALKATEAGYQVGTRTIVEVLNAQQERFGAERDYLKSQYNYLLNTLRLKQAAGTLSEDDLRLINSLLASQ